MAKNSKNKKQEGKNSPVFFKDTSTVKNYRDEKGRFISKEKAVQIGIAPEFHIVTKFRDQKGKIVSAEKVKKSKKKVVERIKIKGKLKEIKPEKIKSEGVIKQKDNLNYKQEFWQSVRSNIQRDILTKQTAVKVNGKLFLVDKKESLIIGDFITKLDFLILQFFDNIGGLSPVAFISSASTKNKVVYDFDQFQFSEDIEELSEEEEVINKEIQIFKKEFQKLKNQYFKK